MKRWIAAARLRTLPLAIGGIILGSALAAFNHFFNWTIFGLAIATSVSLQILSNFANDYGDFKKGTDGEKRSDRALASGVISPKAMLNAIIVFVILCLIFGLRLLYVSFGNFDLKLLLWFLIGLAAIAAAIKYTMGKNPYGYSAKGDIMVFIFFGIISVLGVRFLYSQIIDIDFYWAILPAISFGALSTAVLNINNIRDIEDDKLSNKITLAVKLGRSKAVIYQAVLLLMAFATSFTFLILYEYYFSLALLAVLSILFVIDFLKLKKGPANRIGYNQLLKKMVISSLLFSLVFVAQLFW